MQQRPAPHSPKDRPTGAGGGGGWESACFGRLLSLGWGMNLGRDPVERKEERRRKLKGGEMTLRSGRARGGGGRNVQIPTSAAGEHVKRMNVEKGGGGILCIIILFPRFRVLRRGPVTHISNMCEWKTAKINGKIRVWERKDFCSQTWDMKYVGIKCLVFRGKRSPLSLLSFSLFFPGDWRLSRGSLRRTDSRKDTRCRLEGREREVREGGRGQ